MKHQMMDEAFQSEVMVLTTALNRIAEQDRRYRDFTINNLRAVLGGGNGLLPDLSHLHDL
jgi:hypothetical protein